MWMVESQRVSVEFLPIGFEDQRLQLVELRSAGIRSQNLEIRVRRVQITSETNRIFDCLFRFLQKSDYVESRRHNTQFPAEIDYVTHVLVRDIPAGDLFQY